MTTMDLLERLVPAQHRNGDVHRQALLQAAVLVLMAIMGALLLASEIITQPPIPGVGTAITYATVIPTALAFYFGRSLSTPAHVLGTLTTFNYLGVVILQGGLSAPALPILLIPPMLVMSIAGRIHGAFWGIVVLSAIVGLAIVGELPDLMPSPNILIVDYGLPLTAVLITLGLTFSFVEGGRDRVERALQQETARAESAMQARSDFLATMSHEIRTPMNGVLGMAELLADSNLAPQEAERVEVLQEAGTSLMRLLDDILDLSKLQAGAIRLEHVPMDVASIARRVVALFSNRIGETHIELVVQAPDSLWVLGDPTRTRQVMSNLISNATKFTRSGRVTVRVAVEGALWSVEVQDSGIGMTQAEIAKLFEPFVQADASTTRQYGGTGLGLSIVGHLCEAMAGEITVTSTPGIGSTFRVVLPYEHASEPTPVLVAGPRPMTTHRRRLQVLIVEDNAINQRLVRAMLETLGVSDITTVEDGVEAVSAFRSRRFDLILMDMQMPRMDGVDATTRIRSLEADQSLPHTPIIALTANALADDEARCRAAGMDDFLTKPLQRASLARALDQIAPDLATAPASGALASR